MEGALSIEIFLQVLCDDNCGAAVEARFARFSHDDWEALYSFGSDNGLLPAFCARLSALKLQNIPAEFSSRLKNLYISNLKKNLILEQELFKALASFRENNIPVIPLKGPALAQFLYDDAALRRAPCDLDLLVKPEKFAEAEGALNKGGYSCRDRAAERGFKLKYSRQLSFIRKAQGIGNFLIELHSDLRPLYAYPSSRDFWEGAREFNLDGQKILQPANEDLLIYLSLVAMTITEFIELRYLYDIYALVTKTGKELNWQVAAKKLEGSRHGPCVFFALTLTQRFFPCAVPQEFLAKIKLGLAKRLFLNLWINRRNVLRQKPGAGLGRYYFMTFWHYFVTSYLYSNSLPDCIRMIYKKIFLPQDEMEFLYSPSSPPTAAPFLCLQRLLKPAQRIFSLRKNRH